MCCMFCLMSSHESHPLQTTFSLMHAANITRLRCSFPAEQAHQDYRGGLSGPSLGPIPNCIKWRADWSPCSHSCGPGVSTRSSNRNWACRLQTETRLCQVRPCQTLLPGLRRLQPVSEKMSLSVNVHLSVPVTVPVIKHSRI